MARGWGGQADPLANVMAIIPRHVSNHHFLSLPLTTATTANPANSPQLDTSHVLAPHLFGRFKCNRAPLDPMKPFDWLWVASLLATEFVQFEHFTDMQFLEYSLCNLTNKVRHLPVWPWMFSAGFGMWNDGFARCCFVHRCWNSFFHWLLLYARLWDRILWL